MIEIVPPLVAKLDVCQLSSSHPVWVYKAQDALVKRMPGDKFDESISRLLSRTPPFFSCAKEISTDLRALAGAGKKMEHRPLSVDLKTLKMRVIQFSQYLESYYTDLILELEKRISETPKTPLTLWLQELRDVVLRMYDDYKFIRLQLPQFYQKDLSPAIAEWQLRLDDLENKFRDLSIQKGGLAAGAESLVERFDETYALFTSIHMQVNEIQEVAKTRDAARCTLHEEGKALRG